MTVTAERIMGREIDAMTLRTFLLNLSINYGSPFNTRSWGFYYTSEKDVLISSQYFVMLIKGLEVVDLEPDSFFNVFRNEVVKGNQYPIPVERAVSVIFSHKSEFEAEFPLPNLLKMMAKLSQRQRLKSRIIMSPEAMLSQNDPDMIPIVFNEMYEGRPTTIVRGKPVSSSDPNAPLGIPFLAKLLGSDGEKFLVEPVMKAGAMNFGIHCAGLDSPGGFFDPRAYTMDNLPFHHIPQDLVEPTNVLRSSSGASIAENSNVPEIHMDCTMIYDLLKPFEMCNSPVVQFNIPSAVVLAASPDQSVFERTPPKTVMVQNKPQGDSDLDIKFVYGLLNTATGPQRR